MKRFTLNSQATVQGNKYINMRRRPFNTDHPATPLEFHSRKVQRQLTLMMAIKQYAETNAPAIDGGSPRITLNEWKPGDYYRQELRNLLLPAIRGLGALLHGRFSTGSTLARPARYITLESVEKTGGD